MEVIGYLTEGKLEAVLQEWAGAENVQKEVNVPTTRMRWDYLVLHKGITYAVEFDGESHYRDINVIERDLRKRKIAIELDYIPINIPYFVQLNVETFHHFFGEYLDLHTTYAHGFIDGKAYLPASFCTYGLGRYEQDLKQLPKTVSKAIIDSLIAKAKKIGYLRVFPEK